MQAMPGAGQPLARLRGRLRGQPGQTRPECHLGTQRRGRRQLDLGRVQQVGRRRPGAFGSALGGGEGGEGADLDHPAPRRADPARRPPVAPCVPAAAGSRAYRSGAGLDGGASGWVTIGATRAPAADNAGSDRMPHPDRSRSRQRRGHGSGLDRRRTHGCTAPRRIICASGSQSLAAYGADRIGVHRGRRAGAQRRVGS